jgi:hypothetical protein
LISCFPRLIAADSDLSTLRCQVIDRIYQNVDFNSGTCASLPTFITAPPRIPKILLRRARTTSVDEPDKADAALHEEEMGGDLGSFGSAGSVVYEAPGSLDYMDPSLLHVEPRRWAEEGNETATLSGVSAFPQPSNFLPRLSLPFAISRSTSIDQYDETYCRALIRPLLFAEVGVTEHVEQERQELLPPFGGQTDADEMDVDPAASTPDARTSHGELSSY